MRYYNFLMQFLVIRSWNSFLFDLFLSDFFLDSRSRYYLCTSRNKQWRQWNCLEMVEGMCFHGNKFLVALVLSLLIYHIMSIGVDRKTVLTSEIHLKPVQIYFDFMDSLWFDIKCRIIGKEYWPDMVRDFYLPIS